MIKTLTKNLPDLEPKKLWLISFPPMSNNTSVGHCLCSETGRDHGQGRTGLSQEGWVEVPAVRRIVIVADTLVRMCVCGFFVWSCVLFGLGFFFPAPPPPPKIWKDSMPPAVEINGDGHAVQMGEIFLCSFELF